MGLGSAYGWTQSHLFLKTGEASLPAGKCLYTMGA